MKLKPVGSNQTEAHVNGWIFFYSYDTLVAARSPLGSAYRTNRKYRATTSKHLTQWLGGPKAGEPTSPEELEKLLVRTLSEGVE